MPSKIQQTTKDQKNSAENQIRTTAITSDTGANRSSTNWFTRLLEKVGISKPTPIQSYSVPDESSIYTQADSTSESTDDEWVMVNEDDIANLQPMYHTQITLRLSEAAQARTAKHHNIPSKDIDDEEQANKELDLVQRALLDYAFELMEAEKEVPLVKKVMLDIAEQLEKEEKENAIIAKPTPHSTTYHNDNVQDDDYQNYEDDDYQSYEDDDDQSYEDDDDQSYEEDDDEDEDNLEDEDNNQTIYRY